MNTLLRIFAACLLGIAALFSVLALVALATDSRELLAEDARILAALVGILLFLGILWILTEITPQLGRRGSFMRTPKKT